MTEFTQAGNDGGRATQIVTTPPHFPTMHTRDTVTHLVAFGLDVVQIAVIIRCTEADVKRHYAEELEHGLTRVNARVMSAVLHQALHKEDGAMMKLWLINKAGWRGGDGTKVGILNAPPGTEGSDGTLTIVQKREIITRMMTIATRAKRNEERIIEGEVIETKRANGASGGNGTKHR